VTTRSAPSSGTEDPDPPLSVAAVARRMGVAPATLRTWDRRYGVGPSGHTTGRHRRYDRQDIARLERMQRALLRGASAAEAARFALASGEIGVNENAENNSESNSNVTAADSSLHTGPDDAVPTTTPVIAGDEFEPELDRRATAGIRGLRLPGTVPEARGLGRAVLALDSHAAQLLLADTVRTLGLIRTWDEVVRPVLNALSQRWEQSGLGAELEHLLCECVLATLHRATPVVEHPRNPRPVLLACAPGEQHSLPLHALLAALAQRDVAVRMLGPSLPAEALAAAARRTAPAVVVVWAQLARYADPALADALPRTRQQVRLLLAGPGWSATPTPTPTSTPTPTAPHLPNALTPAANTLVALLTPHPT
jgi:MerR family transcriptional regulator, light-induced transcriptional regulator